MATFIVTHRTGENEIVETTVEHVEDMHVLTGDILVFFDGKGNALFGLPTMHIISFQQILNNIS